MPGRGFRRVSAFYRTSGSARRALGSPLPATAREEGKTVLWRLPRQRANLGRLLVGRFCPRPRKRRGAGVAVCGREDCSRPPAAAEGRRETWRPLSLQQGQTVPSESVSFEAVLDECSPKCLHGTNSVCSLARRVDRVAFSPTLPILHGFQTALKHGSRRVLPFSSTRLREGPLQGEDPSGPGRLCLKETEAPALR